MATDEVSTAGPAATVAVSSDRTSLLHDGEDLAFVTAEIRDAEGTIVPRADNRVEFSVSGPGEVIAVDNGDASDSDSYQISSRRAFAGKCLAIVRATGEGEIEVTASSAGLGSSSVAMLSAGL